MRFHFRAGLFYFSLMEHGANPSFSVILFIFSFHFLPLYFFFQFYVMESGGSHNAEIYLPAAVNIIMDTRTLQKKLNHLGIFPNASNLWKRNIRCISLDRRGMDEVFIINCKLMVSLTI